MAKLEKLIKEKETKFFQNPSGTLTAELNQYKAEYNLLSTRKATSLLKLKQSYYEQGERAGKLLARRIKQVQSERVINSVMMEDEVLTTNSIEINDTFRTFYEKL